jgi:restriction system protein
MGSKKVLSASSADALLKLDGLSQQDAERLVAAAYRVRGYDVRAVKNPDHDAEDLLLTRDGHRLLLQCKYWKTRKIGEMPVRELYGAMAGHSATAGVMLCSGVFTLEATRFANFGGIELLDGPKLRELLLRRPSEDAHSPATRSVAG